MERIGRKDDDALGKGVLVSISTWEGPGSYYPDQEGYASNGCRVVTEHFFPRNQSATKHPIGYDLKTKRQNVTVSPSVSYYSELCRYGQFRWST